ncbi:unnamed protein product [Durusdinium trenchii]|uniref:Uncharacterized protein n=1 Tax=Durusdinium trenchii TaxID=1381693 RepID=A0ABP0QRP1_9DINO
MKRTMQPDGPRCAWRRLQPLLLMAVGTPFLAFCSEPVLASHVERAIPRRASGGVEVSGDSEMLKKLKEWKKTRGAASKGFEKAKAPAPEPAPEPPAPEPEPRLPGALQAVSELLQRRG